MGVSISRLVKWDLNAPKSVFGDYRYIRIKEHPSANSLGYVAEHKVVAENEIGRLLEEDEVVHHINGDKLDNSPDNLAVMKRPEHGILHGIICKKMRVVLLCPHCGKAFVRRKGHTHLTKKNKLNATFCSKQCSLDFAADMRVHGMTDEQKHRIATNVVGFIEYGLASK